MAENKRQHFVPQFYLKNFSDDELHIYAYNIKRKKTFNTLIKTSCRKDYFYGKNLEVEKLLSELESIQKEILDEVISTKNVDVSSSEKHGILLSFLIMQKLRTQAAKTDSNLFLNHFFDQYIKPMMKNNKDFEKYSDEYIQGLKMESPDFFYKSGIPMALESFFAIMDLRPIIIGINSDKEFLTSDNPVIFNNYVDFKGYPLLSLVSPGLQIICPLTNKLMLFLFDNDMYTLKKNSISSEDIDSFNEIQILNCDENVFFKDKNIQEYVENFDIKNVRNTWEKQIRLKILDKKNDETNKKYSEILAVTGPVINYCQKFSFIGLNLENNRRLKGKLRIISKKKFPQIVCRNEEIFQELQKIRACEDRTIDDE